MNTNSFVSVSPNMRVASFQKTIGVFIEFEQPEKEKTEKPHQQKTSESTRKVAFCFGTQKFRT